MIETLDLKSGAKVEMEIASLSESAALRRSMAAEIVKADIMIDLQKLDLKTISQADLAGDVFNSIKNVLLVLVSSETVERQLFVCMRRCRYNDVKITAETFEPKEARGDFLPIALEVIKINVLPFFAGLDWKSLIPSKTEAPVQK